MERLRFLTGLEVDMFRTLLIASTTVGCATGGEIVEERTLVLELEGEAGIDVATLAGSLDVVGESGRASVQMDVVVRQVGFVRLRPEPELTASLESVDGVVRADAAVLDSGDVAADVRLRVPEGFEVDIVDSNGDIVVEHVGALTIADYNGDIEAFVVSGDVAIDDGPGDVLLENIDGDVDIVDGPGDIVLRHVSGSARIEDGRGDILLEDVEEVELVDAGSGSVLRR